MHKQPVFSGRLNLLQTCVRGDSHIASSHGFRQIDASEWVVVALRRYDLTHEISIFVKILFNFKKKTLA